MSPTGIRSMDREVNVAMDWLKDVDEELAWEDRQKSFQATRSALHALRDRLTPDEAADLASQLPAFLRGIYYEGYKPSRTPRKDRDVQEFLEHIRQEFKNQPVVDAERIAKCVFSVLSKRVSPGEIDDVKQMFPREMRYLWPEGQQPS